MPEDPHRFAARASGRWPQDDNSLPGLALGAHRGDLEDLLQALPDRPELERLYQRDVPLRQILRLLGHQVDNGKIRDLVRSDDPNREIRRILAST